MIPELARSIENILLQSPQGLSEYELISKLQNQLDSEGGSDFSRLNLQDTFELFQIHFLIFHCLYLLKDRWLSEEKYCLQISPLKISLLPYIKSKIEELVETDHLRIYYLDISNLENTDKQQAEDLIASFWKKFSASSGIEDALVIMGLEEGAGYEQIKQQYRLLVMQYHPDRGDDSQKLAEINQAMDTIKRFYGKS